ncbi:MAG TPA: hypothetical protein VEJ36_01740, partial [Nitrososphaerales archaeon]|nr:hypothetical protein [Nitrososphaerales archaeon]
MLNPVSRRINERAAEGVPQDASFGHPNSQVARNPVTQPQEFDVRYARRALVLFGLVVLTVMYIEIMLYTSLPKIAEQYKVSLGETTLVLALYTVFGTAVTPILGKLGDIHGKKKVLV